MSTRDNYLRQQAEAEAHAAKSPNGDLKRSWEAVARQWGDLARQAGHPTGDDKGQQPSGS